MGALLDAALFAHQQNPTYGARMLQTSAQSIATNAYTTLTYQSVEFDTTGGAMAQTGAGELVATRTGLWAISATVTFVTTATQNGKWFWAAIARNGSVTDFAGQDSTIAYNGTFNTSVSPSGILRLATGDFVDLIANQNSGAAVNTAPSQSFLAMAFLGPA